MMLRMLLLVLLFIIAFADGIERPEDVQLAYSLVLRLLICFTLFAAGNVLKTLLAKLLASHVHRQAFFDKMQDALQKVGPQKSCNLLASWFWPSRARLNLEISLIMAALNDVDYWSRPIHMCRPFWATRKSDTFRSQPSFSVDDNDQCSESSILQGSLSQVAPSQEYFLHALSQPKRQGKANAAGFAHPTSAVRQVHPQASLKDPHFVAVFKASLTGDSSHVESMPFVVVIPALTSHLGMRHRPCINRCSEICKSVGRVIYAALTMLLEGASLPRRCALGHQMLEQAQVLATIRMFVQGSTHSVEPVEIWSEVSTNSSRIIRVSVALNLRWQIYLQKKSVARISLPSVVAPLQPC